jgi:hypothetical protein
MCSSALPEAPLAWRRKTFCVQEMMVAVGLNRARIRLGKWVHLKFHLSWPGRVRARASRQKQPAAILLTTGHGLPFFVAGTIN